MIRVFTKRIACRACGHYFTITSAASKFCKDTDCIRRRRKAARQERKRQLLAAAQRTLQPGSSEHLDRALWSGE